MLKHWLELLAQCGWEVPHDEMVRRQVDKLQATAYVHRDRPKSTPRSSPTPNREEDTVLDEGDTWTGQPIPTSTPKNRQRTQPANESPSKPNPPAARQTQIDTGIATSSADSGVAELSPAVRHLVEQADALVGSSRIREATKILDDAYRASRKDVRIGGLLFTLIDNRVRISVPDRIEQYRQARSQLS